MNVSSEKKIKNKNKNKSVSLQDLCYDSLTSSMQTAPPLLQEIIMGETSERMKKQLIGEAYDIAREKAIRDICDELEPLVTDIMENMIMSMAENGRNTKSFRDEYHKLLHPDILECAIKISENIVQNLESKFLYRALGVKARSGFGNYDSDIEYDEYDSDENSRQQFYSDPDVSDSD